MQGELRQGLGNQGDHAGVVGARRYLAEDHLVAADEQLHPEQAVAAQCRHHLARHGPGIGQGLRGHGLGLPGFPVIAILLAVTDGLAVVNAVHRADGQQGDFVVEIHKALDDDPATAGAAALLGVAPGRFQISLAAQQALALAGGAHHRLGDTRITQSGRRGGKTLVVVGKGIGRGG